MDLSEKHVLPTKLLIKRIPREKRFTPGGLEIPDTAEEATTIGEIVIVGEGTPAVPMPMHTGQRVMYPPRNPVRVKIEDADFYLLDVRDVLLYW